MRIPFVQREKVAIVKLRRVGYSVNLLSKIFSRSTSVIKRILDFNTWVGNFRRGDMRKLPTHVKRLQVARLWATWQLTGARWIAWISGEGERPP